MRELYFWIGVGALAALGLVLDQSYMLHVMILCFIWVIVVTGWDLVMGYAGIFNFAQLVFFAVGAYASSMLSIHAGLTPMASIALSGAIAGMFGLIVALPCLRLRGEYVALFTFAIHLALPTLIEQGRALGTGGSTGLLGLPPLELFGYTFRSIEKLPWYYFTLAVSAALVWLVYFVILKHRSGRAFVALRDSENFAKSLGVDDWFYKLIVFALSAVITGIAGALYAHYVGVVTPKILGNEFFLMVMVMLSVGGLGRFPGAILGAFLITIGNEVLRDTGQYRLLLLGIIVVLTLILAPGGIMQIRDRLSGYISARKRR